MAEKESSKRGHRFIDLSGLIFGDWDVMCFGGSFQRKLRWNCRCQCGTERLVLAESLRSGKSSGCGCHGTGGMMKRKHAREYRSWTAAKNRCSNPRNPAYIRYGARGIAMSAEWQNSLEAFYRDMGPRPIDTELDRINNDGPYTGPCIEFPDGNCRWATRTVNSRNRRRSTRIEYQGRIVSLRELAELTGIKYSTLKNRRFSHKPLLP